MILFFDTETNGRPIDDASDDDARQPRVCELGALLTDDRGNDVNFISLIIRPDGWTIPPELVDIHGISQEHAERVGVPILTALSAFRFLARPALRYVAHAAKFDRDRVNGEMAWAKKRSQFEIDPAKCFCTMLASMDECRIPIGYYRRDGQKWKWPKLAEAYEYFFGEKIEKAHNAFADLQACKRIYFKLVELGRVPTLE